MDLGVQNRGFLHRVVGGGGGIDKVFSLISPGMFVDKERIVSIKIKSLLTGEEFSIGFGIGAVLSIPAI